MTELAINLTYEQMVLLGFACAWFMGAMGSAIRAILRFDKGGDPGI